MLKKFILLTCLSLFGFINYYSFWYQVDLPNPTQNIQSEWTIIASKVDEDDEKKEDRMPYFEYLVKILTTYIWLFTWVVAFWVVLFAWFLLTTSQWTPEDLKKANKMLVWWLVGIFVSLLSYLLVKVLINLF